MRPPKIVGGMGLLIIAIFVALYQVVFKSMMKSGAENYLQQNAPQARQALNNSLSSPDPVCIYEGPFPLMLDPQPRPGAAGKRCDRCEDLVQTGLLTKHIEEQALENGQRAYVARFELTEFGRSVYSEVPDATLTEADFKRRGSRKYPRFCFGKTVLHKVTETAPMVMSGGDYYLALRYVAEVTDPHPFLYDPASKPLRLPVPSRGKVALFPPRGATVVIYRGGDTEIEHEGRQGK